MEEREEILKIAEAARLLGVSPVTVGKWVKAGDFPHAFRLNPRTQSQWRIPKSDVDEFIRNRRRQQGYFRMPVELISEQ